ncbi:MAG: hypothetical protein ATN33_05645 [Epulopiscium sp. Nele67-Bin001]|nr:MAG: hypothetical protein BEN18_06850 [Epulopiscium sp. Nuni2H_MBin001]OON93504.1 MAG: hypothetical protein ATN33_05645 [Epulopiscium sp. Nele67-Bin001]
MKNFISKVVTTMLIATMGVSLAGCSSSEPTTTSGADVSAEAASQETIKLEFWYSWTDQIQENNINLSNMFNETIGKEKGIEIVPVYQGSYDETHQKLQASYIAGQAPALSVMEIASTKLFAENGIIKSLDDYIDRDDLDVDDFYTGLTENCIVDGEYYGLPYLRSTPILYLNKTLLEQAGLDPVGPATWDEMAQYCEVIYNELGIVGLTNYSYDWVFEAFFFQEGTSVLNADETATNINTAEGKKIFSYFQDLIQNGYAKMYAGVDSSKVAVDVMNQNTAMWFSSTGDLTKYITLADESGFDITASYIPAGVTYGVPTGGCNIVMTTGLTPAEEEAAWEFMKWLTDTEQTVYASIYTGYVTTRQSAVETDEIQALFEELPEAKIALDQLEQYGHGRPMHSRYAEVKKEFVNAMDAVWVNNADVDTTLAETEAKVNAILAN